MAQQNEASKSTYVPKGVDNQVKWLENMHSALIAYKEKWTRNWPKNAQIYRGNNWDTKKDGNPFFKTNLARTKLDRKSAKMTASKPIIAIMPHRDKLTNTAKVLQRTIDAGWDACAVQMRIEMLSAFVRPFGCGFFKTIWDPRARHGLGDIVIAEIDPRRVDLDPYALRSYDIDRSTVIVHETTVPYSWIEANFPEHADEVTDFDASPPTADDDVHGMRLTGGPVRTPLKYFLGTGGARSGNDVGRVTPVPYCRIREFWYADPATSEGESKYPNGRVTYLVGSGRKAVIVNPETNRTKNPFFDGQWPFDMYDARGDIDHPWGSSQVEDVRRLEEAVNRAGHMAIRSLIQNVPFITVESGALSPDNIKRLQEFGHIVMNRTRGLEVSRVPALNAINEAMNIIQQVKSLMDESIGLAGDATGGKGRVEVRSPDLLFGLEQSGADLINQEARRLESFLERVGAKWVSRIFQFYTKDRFIPYITGSGFDNFQFEVQQLREEINQIAVESVSARMSVVSEDDDDKQAKFKKTANFDTVVKAISEALRGAWKEFDFKIVPLSSLASTRAARSQTLANFAQMGFFPFAKLLEEAGFNNWEDLIQERARENAALSALGLLPPPGAQGGQSSKKK